MNEEQYEDLNTEEQLSSREEQVDKIKRTFHPEKSKVVRNELFANLRDAAVTIRDGNITFNTACINGLEDVVYVNLLIDEEHRMIAIRGCHENDKNAIRWCVAKPDKRKSRRLRCPDFTDPLYELMGWDKKCRYKVLGYKVDYEDGTYYVFDLNVQKIYRERPKKGEEPVNENGEVVQTPVDRKGYFPDDIANTFGIPMEQVKKEAQETDIGGFVDMDTFVDETRDSAQAESQGESAHSLASVQQNMFVPQ